MPQPCQDANSAPTLHRAFSVKVGFIWIQLASYAVCVKLNLPAVYTVNLMEVLALSATRVTFYLHSLKNVLCVQLFKQAARYVIKHLQDSLLVYKRSQDFISKIWALPIKLPFVMLLIVTYVLKQTLRNASPVNLHFTLTLQPKSVLPVNIIYKLVSHVKTPFCAHHVNQDISLIPTTNVQSVLLNLTIVTCAINLNALNAKVFTFWTL